MTGHVEARQYLLNRTLGQPNLVDNGGLRNLSQRLCIDLLVGCVRQRVNRCYLGWRTTRWPFLSYKASDGYSQTKSPQEPAVETQHAEPLFFFFSPLLFFAVSICGSLRTLPNLGQQKRDLAISLGKSQQTPISEETLSQSSSPVGPSLSDVGIMGHAGDQVASRIMLQLPFEPFTFFHRPVSCGRETRPMPIPSLGSRTCPDRDLSQP